MSGKGGPDHPIVVDPESSRFFRLPPDVRLVEPASGSQGATYPAGFLAAGVVGGLKDSGRPDMGVLAVASECRGATASAAVFTTNAFAAAPVRVNQTECDLDHLLAVAMNSGNANACTGEQGLGVARVMQESCAVGLGIAKASVAVGSTGIIGVPLDEAMLAAGIRKASQAVVPDGGPAFEHSVMTTDRFPKMCALDVPTVDGLVHLGVCAKGAGMISPAMATMLCVVTTDATLQPAGAKNLLKHAVDTTFNRITVDGEMSTNDSVFFIASGASGVSLSTEGLDQLGAALDAMLLRIALMMVADGEGATKIVRLQVAGAPDEPTAVYVARAIAGSPLVKTAVCGEDPNWGRVISAAGAAMRGKRLPRASLLLGGVKVVENAAAFPVSESDNVKMHAAMKEPELDIHLDLGAGEASAEIFFSDMGHEYITINAEYHT